MRYATHLFDCDGVLLASNDAKARAFYNVALEYGEDIATRLAEYHKHAGSTGRLARFRYLFDELLKREPEAGEIDSLMTRCTAEILLNTKNAHIMSGLEEYLESIKPAERWVVSGIEHSELVSILDEKFLSHHRYFEWVFGSPPTKLEIVKALESNIKRPAVFYGDAEEDYLCAVEYDMDFVLVTSDSDWDQGPDLLYGDSRTKLVADFSSLLKVGADV